MSANTATIYVRVPPIVKKALEREALRERRTLSAQLALILQERYAPTTVKR